MKLITKKYLFKNVDTVENGLCIKVVCGVQGEHDELVNAIKNDDKIVFCGVEYVNEIDLEAMTCPEIIKNTTYETEKEDEKNEEV